MDVSLTDEMIIARVSASLDDGATTQSLSPQELNSIEPNVFQRSHITNVDKNTNKPTILNPNSNLENSHYNYLSSPRISRMSMASTFSQASSFSQDSSSSWYSAGTVTSSSDRPITPATTVSFSPTQHGSYNKHDSIEQYQLSSTNYSRPLSFNSSLSPPFCALPPLPSNSVDIRPDSPVYSLISEYSDTFGENSQLPQTQKQVQVPTQQSRPSSHSDHHANPDPKPPRPPRNPNRPLSPELSLNTKLSHTGPQSPSSQQYNSPAVSGPGVPFNLHSHAQSYTASSPSSQSHVHAHFSHFYPTHSNLSHVKEEEEEGQNFQSETGSGGRERDHRFDDIDVRSDYTDDHEYEFDRQSDGIDVSGDNTDGERSHRNFYLAEFHGSVGGGARRSVWSPYTSFLPSVNTGVSSEGNSPVSSSRSPTIKNKWIESTTLAQRARSHLSRLKKWKKRAVTTVIEGSSNKLGKEGAQIGTLERSMVVRMISDALEMARSCYSVRVHKLGYELGKEVQQWLQTFTDNDPAVLNKKENVTLLTTVQTCFLPILLIRIAQIEPSAATLANNLIVALTKAPLSLHEDETPISPLFTSLPSNNRNPVDMPQPIPSSSHINSIPVIPQRSTSISSIAIHMVAQELGSPTPICPSQHPWLGMTLLKIVEMTVKLRLLSFGEIEDIAMVGRKREGEYTQQSASKSSSSPLIGALVTPPPWEVALFGRKREGQYISQSRSNSSSSPVIDAPVTRPWEVALFALCGSTETPAAPFFKRMVLGSMGIPLLVRSLDSLMALNIDMGDVKWEDVGLTLRALAFVSKHRWVVQGISGDDNEGERKGKIKELVKSIMNVFWRSIPERWFSIRYWAMDAVRNIVSHQHTLIRLLAEIEADKAFLTLTPSSPLYPRTINTTRTSGEGDGKTRNRLLEEYRKESAKRAEEMVEYIRTRSGARNRDDSKRESKDTAVLQPVAIGFDGR